MLLILTNCLDFAADYLILRLRERNVRYFRLNSEDVPVSEVVCRHDRGAWATTWTSPAGGLSFEDIMSVWLRRKVRGRSTRVSGEDRVYANAETEVLLESLFASLTCRWINPMRSTELAEKKLHVLRVASRLGFQVPRTIATNSPSAFESDVAPNAERWVAKPLYHGLIAREDGLFAVQTRRVSELGPVVATNIAACPTIFQEEVPRGRDLRVTVVGDRVFAASVTWDATAYVDWRVREARPRFDEVSLDAGIQVSILRLLRELELVYGAVDLIEAANGDCYFLEVNPAGEFAWLEEQLRFPVRDALIDEMTRAG